MSDGFRLRLGARRFASTSLPYVVLSACAPLPASRPQTEADESRSGLCGNTPHKVREIKHEKESPFTPSDSPLTANRDWQC